jgi:hypothetical protein
MYIEFLWFYIIVGIYYIAGSISYYYIHKKNTLVKGYIELNAVNITSYAES